jgi:hypothetical protein
MHSINEHGGRRKKKRNFAIFKSQTNEKFVNAKFRSSRFTQLKNI